eukprot:TRINITY_DN1502_c0_g1_i3.p1 TRINITY_DN1502_c0_g1~~TRINITY_DN1502_c0_g1_i3.p1  ORF type:complete len:202 (-),score=70.44 TRINITY_DN1502_c0_g1_i3:1027-1602(-)
METHELGEIAERLHISSDKVEMIHVAFLKTGKRYDGELSKAEFKTLAGNLVFGLPEEVLEEMDPVERDDALATLDRFFEIMDVDKSGGVSFREFCLWMGVMNNKEVKRDTALADCLFEIFDHDKSGALDVVEVRQGYDKIVAFFATLGGNDHGDSTLEREYMDTFFAGKKEIDKAQFREALTLVKKHLWSH